MIWCWYTMIYIYRLPLQIPPKIAKSTWLLDVIMGQTTITVWVLGGIFGTPRDQAWWSPETDFSDDVSSHWLRSRIAVPTWHDYHERLFEQVIISLYLPDFEIWFCRFCVVFFTRWVSCVVWPGHVFCTGWACQLTSNNCQRCYVW